MLIVALVLAVIGLAALVTAVITSNELIAWVCIAASAIGVLLLIVDALRERSKRGSEELPAAEAEPTEQFEAQPEFDADYPEEPPGAEQPDLSIAEAPTTTLPADQTEDEVAGEDRNSR